MARKFKRLPRGLGFPRLGFPKGPRFPRGLTRSALKRSTGKLARFLLRSRLLLVFLTLCVLGVIVGLQTRPDPKVVPYGDLFNQMSVVSYRESPSDTSARFMVELSAGGKVFRRYDVDARTFLSPATDRDYNRSITGTSYRPLQARGHVTQGLWLDVRRRAGPSLVPDQFNELYRATLDYLKPVSLVAGVVSTLSGYSVGYRIGSWNGSLASRAVQERVLATPDLGRLIAREAWRRVLLEPTVMGTEGDAARFAAVRGTQQLYSNFLHIALNDSDGFIPREAERLAQHGRATEARTMLEFVAAVHRAAVDSVHVTSVDFSAVERWASLLVRRGHWAADAIPPAGEERARYIGMLAYYGIAPPPREPGRVWVGSRMLVREGDSRGFVADDILSKEVACPIAWRTRLREENSGASATVNAWFSDRPEFVAIGQLTVKAGRHIASAVREVVERPGVEPSRSVGRVTPPTTTAAFPGSAPDGTLPLPVDSALIRLSAPDSTGGRIDSTVAAAKDSAGP